MTYFVIDTRSGEIVNACESSPMTPDQQRQHLAHYVNAEHLSMKPEAEVPMAVKQRYRYWNERP